MHNFQEGLTLLRYNVIFVLAIIVVITSAPLRGRLTPPASLAQGRMQLKHVRKGGRKERLMICCD